MSGGSSRFQLKQVAFFGRTLAEYLKMFSLDLEALRGLKVLDVASGPGSFVAEALAMGLDATGCDPMYAQDADTIAAQGKADIESCREQIRRNPGVLAYGDIEKFYAETYAALEKFAADFRQSRGESRYVSGALPSLHDGDDFGLDFHTRAFRELARVTRHELRVAGMHTWTQPPKPHPYCEPVTRVLEEAGFAVELVPTDYDDGCQASGGVANQALMARRR